MVLTDRTPVLVLFLVRRLFLLHGAVVIDEYEGALVFGVLVALGALVAWT